MATIPIPAEAARELLAPIAAGEADMTVGDRISNGSYKAENGRRFHGFGNALVRRLIRVLYGHSFEDVLTGYRAFSRAFVKTMPVMSKGFQIEAEISVWAVDHRWRTLSVPSTTVTAPRVPKASSRPMPMAPSCSPRLSASFAITAPWRSSVGSRSSSLRSA